MSDTNSAGNDAAQPDQHLTVEDAGTTTDPADLAADDAEDVTTSDGSDDMIGHVFDQTNGVIDGLDGDSDGTAESDSLSAGDRALEDPTIEDDDVRTDDDGVDDLRDPNP